MIEHELARCWPWLAAAAERGRDAGLTEADLLRQLLGGQAQLWPGQYGALVTQLVRTAEGGALHVWLGGGRLSALLEMRAGLEAWGRAQGAQFATIDGRKGWDRLFGRFGYARQGKDLVKRL